MKVKELILELQKCNPEDIVLVHGYEVGYCDVDKIKKIKVELNVNTESYNGPHDETENSTVDAYLISRIDNPLG